MSHETKTLTSALVDMMRSPQWQMISYQNSAPIRSSAASGRIVERMASMREKATPHRLPLRERGRPNVLSRQRHDARAQRHAHQRERLERVPRSCRRDSWRSSRYPIPKSVKWSRLSRV